MSIDYEELERVILRGALGDDEEMGRETVRTMESVNSDGTKRHVTSRSSRKAPDIALAQRLLDQRIGGPQDFC